MGGLSSVLPFLAALRKQVPDAGGFVDDTSGSGSEAGWTPNLGADWGNAPGPAPTPPPGPIAQQPVSQLPNLADPSMAPQASQVPEDKGNYFRQPYETKGHALLSLLQRGLVGGLSGLAQSSQTYAQTGRSGGFGGGVAAGFTQALPFEKQMQALQLQHGGLTNEQLMQMLPFLRAQQFANLGKTQAETQNLTAQAGKAGAEASAIPVKTQLEQAQTQAAYYKDDPNLGLIDIRTGQPIAGNAASAPLTDQEAAVLGKQTGERVPLKIKNQANEIMNRGIKSVQAGGRSLLVDNQGNTIKDMGQATPMAVINAQMSGPPGGQISPDMQNAASMVANGQVDLATAARPFMRFPGQYMALLSEIERQKPGYFQGNFEAAKKVLDSATSGPISNEINAFNTALAHADLLQRAAGALGNGDVQTLNGLKNAFTNEFGATGPVTAQTIADAYTREVNKMLTANHVSDSEINAIGKTINPNKQSLAQIQSVLGAYKALAASKLQQRQNQVTQGMQGKPNFPQNAPTPPPGASHAVIVNGKTVGYTSDGKTMTPAPQ